MGCGPSSYDDEYGGYSTDSNGYRNSRYRSYRNGYPSHHRTGRYPNQNEFRTTTVEEHRPIETSVRRTVSPAIHETTTTIVNEGRPARASPVVSRHEEIRVTETGSTSTRSQPPTVYQQEYVTRHNQVEPATKMTTIEERRYHEPELLPASTTTTSHWDRVKSSIPRRQHQTVEVWDDRPIRNTYSHVRVARDGSPVTTHYYDDRNPASWYRRERTAQRMRLNDVVDKRRRHQDVVTSLYRQGTGYNDPAYRSSWTRRY